MIFAKDRLLYLGNCFNDCLEIHTRARFCSSFLNHVWKLFERLLQSAFSYIPSCTSCISSNQILYFFNHFWLSCSFRTACMSCIFYWIYTTFIFLTPPCDRWKRKFIVPINTTYFIKYSYMYVFRLYTKNTATVFGEWKETFFQPF
jgi:hypothetical protein